MALYSLSLRTVGSSGPQWAAMSPAGNEATLYELRWITVSASGAIGVGRSPNIPVFSGAVNVLPEDYARPAGQTQCAVSFTTAPLVPLQFFRRSSTILNTGGGVCWVFTRGLVIPAGGPALVLWTLFSSSLAGLADVDCVVDE